MTPDTQLPELLDAPLICSRILRLDTRTLRRWVSAGTFPRPDIAIGAKVRLWKRETCEAWIQARAENTR